MKFITIKESHYVTDLTVLKSKLESEGIICNLKDEYSTQVLSHLPNMMVKLQVYEKDLEKAGKILSDSGEFKLTNNNVLCPECMSDNIKYIYTFQDKLQIFWSLIISLFTLKFVNRITGLQNCRCKDCGCMFTAAHNQ